MYRSLCTPSHTDLNKKILKNLSKIHSEEDEDEIPSETETEKELMDDFFEKVSLNDHSPLEIDKICLHADNIKVMSPTKITKVRL